MHRQSAQNNGLAKRFLRKRSDYLKTYKGGFIRRKVLVLYGRFNGLQFHRFGVTTPKATGSAVIRNRYKRWCREFYRQTNLLEGVDPVDLHVFVGSKKASKKDFKDVKYEEFKNQISSAVQSLVQNLEQHVHRPH